MTAGSLPRVMVACREKTSAATTSTRTHGNSTTSPGTSSEANEVAAQEAQRLRDLQDLFWVEAAKSNVLPLDDRFIERADPRTEGKGEHSVILTAHR